jgi:glycopeptide antibiotics resistance protein
VTAKDPARLGRMEFEPAVTPPSGDPSAGPVDDGFVEGLATRSLGKAVLFLSLLLILFFGCFPFDFSFPADWARTIRSEFDVGTRQFFLADDVRDNLLFFMPLGFAFALLTPGHLGVPRRFEAWTRWLARAFAALIAGGCVSAVVEVGQCFLGDRDPSVVDVTNNALGTAFGFGGLGLLAPSLLPRVVRLLRAGSRIVGWKVLAITSVLWVLLAIIPLHYAKDFGDLIRWDRLFSVTVGNSAVLRRPWRGTVEDVFVADRAVADSEAAILLEAPLDAGIPAVFGNDLGHVRAWFDLTRGWPIVDRSRQLSPLVWFANAYRPTRTLRLMAGEMPPTTQPPDAGIAIDGDTAWLGTEAPATPLIDAIKSSSEFTFVATIATADSFQRGPARIVTISDGNLLGHSFTRGNNFNIGQDRRDLAMQLRARVTAKSGMAPQIIVEDVFADTKPKRVLVTYRPWQLSIYVDHVRNRSELTFTPEAALIWQLYPRPHWTFRVGSHGPDSYRPVYRCLVFIPLGALLAMSTKLAGLTRRTRRLVIALGAVVACILLEAIGAQAGIVGFRASGAIVCLGSALLGASLVRSGR